jgi:lysozyme
MAEYQDWIAADDDQLIDSIEKHEGTKEVIYAALRAGRLKAAVKCNAEACMQNGTWPAYVDSEGLDTVGIGHLITGREDYDCYIGVSDENVRRQLAQDIQGQLAGAQQLATEHAMQIAGNHTVQRFMTEMCFNIGKSGYAKFRNGLTQLASAVNGDGQYTYNDAADEHLDSRWAKQVGQRAVEMVDTLRTLDT